MANETLETDKAAVEEMGEVLRRNIDALEGFRRGRDERRSVPQRIAHGLTKFIGSFASVLLHVFWFASWIVVNVGLIPGIEPFDRPPFVLLAVCTSLEAILLTIFVLISQNRQATVSAQRAELDLQISLLTEHELTQVIKAIRAIGDKLELDMDALNAISGDVEATAVIEQIEEARPDDDGTS